MSPMSGSGTDDRADGTPSAGGDLVGPGTGGSPTEAGAGQPSDPRDAAADPDVAALVEDLRDDSSDVRVDPAEAAEQAGTGTDR